MCGKSFNRATHLKRHNNDVHLKGDPKGPKNPNSQSEEIVQNPQEILLAINEIEGEGAGWIEYSLLNGKFE